MGELEHDGDSMCWSWEITYEEQLSRIKAKTIFWHS